MQNFLFFASFCNPELIESENNVRAKDLRTVGKVMAERSRGDGESEKVNAILRGPSCTMQLRGNEIFKPR